MLAPLSGLLRAGLALKVNQVKLAARSYVRDRTGQATDTATSYAVAAGMFAAAGIFLIAACLVGITALFRWIEIKYGLFWAFGAVGGLLLLIAAICVAIAVGRLKRRPRHFPTLASRLRVAVKANPITSNPVTSDPVGAARDTAAAVLLAPSSPLPRANRRRLQTGPAALDISKLRTGLILTATLLGWAAVRRRQQAPRTRA